METLTINAHSHGAAFSWSPQATMISSTTPRNPSSSEDRPRSIPTSTRSPQTSLPTRPNHIDDHAQASRAPPHDQHSHRSQPTTTSPRSTHSQSSDSVFSSGRPSSARDSPRRIKVDSLEHIQSFGDHELERLAQSQSPSTTSTHDGNDAFPQFDISDMSVNDVIEMVAGLLTKITTTNDAQHAHMHSRIPTEDGAGLLSHHAQSVLSFHGKNIPSITILSYLSRIHKYCPATFEVFLSLLVYFDRMTNSINAGPLANLEQDAREFARRQKTDIAEDPEAEQEDSSVATPPSSLSRSSLPNQPTPPDTPRSEPQPEPVVPLSHFFVVDSFNIHRLVIAGITCASKFFSDVFYTNSRYAKVCFSGLLERRLDD